MAATTTPRRRPRTKQSSSEAATINEAPMLDNSRSPMEIRSNMNLSKAAAATGVILNGALPTLLTWGITIGLIFGGCCSNVFALEAIVKDEPDSGLLITFVQFFTVFCLTVPSHLDFSNTPTMLKRTAVPVTHWLPAIAMFCTVNMLNNYAFGFAISVPVHIILRSGGSVVTMIVGYIWGKRYNSGQILGVSMLTIGVIISAMSDAQSKGKMNTSSSGSLSSFLAGLLILFVAQVISAIMGLYIQLTYAKYGPHWHENLFYSHFLSLPLFIPMMPSLWRQFQKLLDSPPMMLSMPTGSWLYGTDVESSKWRSSLDNVWNPRSPSFQIGIPIQVFNLILNALTQFACIRGVNRLGTKTTALGVTIVLNMRKLLSLFLSLWLFGNKLPWGVAIGAATVFTGAAVYGYSGQPRPKTEHHDAEKPKTG